MDNGVQREILDRLIRLETKIDNQDFTKINEKLDTALNKTLNNEEYIKEIKDANKWLWRTVVGSLLLGIIGILFGIWRGELC